MDRRRLERLLDEVREGRLDVPTAVERLSTLPYEDLGFARVDHHRGLRQGLPEVVFCQGKTAPQVAEIVERLAREGSSVLATRATAEIYAAVHARVPEAVRDPVAETIVVPDPRPLEPIPGVLVLTAGTADIPVAQEAVVAAEVMGSEVERVFDVGVAGLHRLLDEHDRLRRARVVVVVAGMDGALPSVVGGLVDVPVVAVPTSIGYGASFGGLAALLTMLNACAPGIAVVNIDNGFGAGFLAGLINRSGARRSPVTSATHGAMIHDSRAGAPFAPQGDKP